MAQTETFEKDGLTVTTTLASEKAALRRDGFKPAATPKKDAPAAKPTPSKN